ncbi:MAG: M3 family oligoendopeptidase, partial [Bacteroidota bacterium]
MYLWDLTHLYPSDKEWKIAKEELVKGISAIPVFRGTLGTSAKHLRECLDLVTNLSKDFARLSSYAGMSSDQDTRNSSALAMREVISQTGSELASAASFIEPEILGIPRTTVEEFLKTEKGLQIYRHYLDDILRRKDHTGTEGEERIIAEAGLMAESPHSIYGIFTDAEFPYPGVTLADGRTVRVDKSAFTLQRASTVREDRAAVFASFFGRLNDYRRTFGTQLNAEVRKNMFYRKARKYPSCLHAALDGNNIPTEVYHSLIDNVNRHLPTFHRYLSLRQRILGVDRLHYYDLYAPLLSDIDLRFRVEEAQKHILDSLAPLGDEYRAVAQRSFTERWIDMFPTEGKRSGAYSNGAAYDVHPYMLMNFHGKYDDVSTLTHELGHTMHSYYSNTHQPY